MQRQEGAVRHLHEGDGDVAHLRSRVDVAGLSVFQVLVGRFTRGSHALGGGLAEVPGAVVHGSGRVKPVLMPGDLEALAESPGRSNSAEAVNLLEGGAGEVLRDGAVRLTGDSVR